MSFLVTQDENGYQVNGYPVPDLQVELDFKAAQDLYVILLSGTPSAKDPIDLRVYSAEVKGYATDVEVFSHSDVTVSIWVDDVETRRCRLKEGHQRLRLHASEFPYDIANGQTLPISIDKGVSLEVERGTVGVVWTYMDTSLELFGNRVQLTRRDVRTTYVVKDQPWIRLNVYNDALVGHEPVSTETVEPRTAPSALVLGTGFPVPQSLHGYGYEVGLRHHRRRIGNPYGRSIPRTLRCQSLHNPRGDQPRSIPRDQAGHLRARFGRLR